MNTQSGDFAIATGVALSVTELVKQVIPELQPRFYPLISLSVGVVMGYMFKFDPITCIIVGLTASGTYSGAKAIIKNI